MPRPALPGWLLRDPYGWPLAVFSLGYGIGQALVTLLAGHRGPHSVEVLLPTVLVVCWVVAMGVGGLCTLIGKVVQSMRWQASGLVLMLVGLVIYAASNLGVGNQLTAGTLAVLAIGTAVELRTVVSAVRARGISRRLPRE